MYVCVSMIASTQCLPECDCVCVCAVCPMIRSLLIYENASNRGMADVLRSEIV